MKLKKSILLSKEISQKVIKDDSYEGMMAKDVLLQLPSQLLHPTRFTMLLALWKDGGLDFKTLKEGTRVKSDGNLAGHLRVLEDLGVIEYKKEFVSRRPKTFYKLTTKGKTQLLQLVKAIKSSINDIE